MVLGGREHILQRRLSRKSAGSWKRSDFSLADVPDWLRRRREIARSVPKLRLSEGESGRSRVTASRFLLPRSGQAGGQPVDDQILRQFDTDEHHLAVLLFDRLPLGGKITAHHLMHALEHDLAIDALHKKHTLVAQQAFAVDLQ